MLGFPAAFECGVSTQLKQTEGETKFESIVEHKDAAAVFTEAAVLDLDQP